MYTIVCLARYRICLVGQSSLTLGRGDKQNFSTLRWSDLESSCSHHVHAASGRSKVALELVREAEDGGQTTRLERSWLDKLFLGMIGKNGTVPATSCLKSGKILQAFWLLSHEWPGGFQLPILRSVLMRLSDWALVQP